MLLKLHHRRACKIESWRELGQPPINPILGQLEVAKKARTDSFSGEWKMRAAVWDHFSFTKLSDVKEEYEANCKYCNNTHYKNPSHVTTFDQRVLVRMFAESRILNFCYFPPPHRGVDIYLFVVRLIKEWSLERKAFSITCDNVGAMDVMVARLKSDLLSFGTLPVASRFIHCQSGMKVIDNSVLKHHEAINYIVASDARLCTFEKCVLDSKCNFVGKLRLYCPTRWNSTYLMLKRALTSEQWTIVQFVCQLLGPFHSITELFSGSDYPTANLYFANVLAIEKQLVLVNNHKIDSIKKKASVMLEKFEKHWGD
ncbi:putative AC transposase [Bienertia sinuspersici]